MKPGRKPTLSARVAALERESKRHRVRIEALEGLREDVHSIRRDVEVLPDLRADQRKILELLERLEVLRD